MVKSNRQCLLCFPEVCVCTDVDNVHLCLWKKTELVKLLLPVCLSDLSSRTFREHADVVVMLILETDHVSVYKCLCADTSFMMK